MLSTVPIPVVVTEPATEPITINDVKRQVNLSESDTDHDVLLYAYMQAAREQWEGDTSNLLITRTMRLTMEHLKEFQFPHRPVQSITSIKYYDLNNVQQTLSTDVYQLDTARSAVRLKYNQDWPSYLDRFDCVEVNYTIGAHTDSTTVPMVAKQAMLLLVGYYFDKNRGDNDGQYDLRAYENLVAKYMRSTYP